jgi:hypothetical protein
VGVKIRIEKDCQRERWCSIMARWLRGVAPVDLDPIQGCPDRVPRVRVVGEAHPISPAQMPILQHAIARVKWGRGIDKVVRIFRTHLMLRQLAADLVTRRRL